MNSIEQAYDDTPQYEWDRLERHRVEYGVTMRALADHLPPAPAKIADIGGSVGRYAIELTRQGYEVTLVDIAEKCLDFARHKADEAGVALAGIVKADARDLSALGDDTFDAVLLMGPLYHLLEHSHRLASILEARRILREGGRVFATFISRFCMVQCAAAFRVPYICDFRDELETILTTGVYRHSESSGTFPDAWFAHPDEILPLMAEAAFRRVDMFSCEPLAYCLEEGINKAPDDLHKQWIDLLYRLSREPSLMGGGGHLLYVGTKSE